MQDAGRGGFGRADASRPWGISQRRVEALASRGLQSCVCADRPLEASRCASRTGGPRPGVTSRRAGRAVQRPGARARRRGGGGFVLGDGRRGGLSVRARSARNAGRGAAGRASWNRSRRRRRRPTTRACSPIAAAPRMRRSPPRYSAVMLTRPSGQSCSDRSARSWRPPCARCRIRTARLRRARFSSRDGCPRRRGTAGRIWSHSARWARCSPSGSDCRGRCTACSSRSPSAGTGRASCAGQGARRSRWQ